MQKLAIISVDLCVKRRQRRSSLEGSIIFGNCLNEGKLRGQFGQRWDILCPTKNTYVEDLKTGNIQYTDEGDTFLTSFQSLVDTLDQPLEKTIEDGLSHGTDGVDDLLAILAFSFREPFSLVVHFNSYLVDVTTLGDELVTDLDPGFQEVHVQLRSINTHHLGDIFTFLLVWKKQVTRTGEQKMEN